MLIFGRQLTLIRPSCEDKQECLFVRVGYSSVINIVDSTTRERREWLCGVRGSKKRGLKVSRLEFCLDWSDWVLVGISTPRLKQHHVTPPASKRGDSYPLQSVKRVDIRILIFEITLIMSR